MAPDRGMKKKQGKGRMLDSRSTPAMKRKAARQVSAGKQIRDIQRMLKRELPREKQRVLEKRVRDLKQKREVNSRVKLDRKLSGRYKQVQFIERRKVERRIRRAEIELRNALDDDTRAAAAEKLASLKEDLEYVRFFPKTEKYISLFMSNNDQEAIQRREKLREVIRARIAAAAATGVELEESPSEEDYSEDDFFMKETTEAESSDEQLANENLTKRSFPGTSTTEIRSQNQNQYSQKQLEAPIQPDAPAKRKRKRKRPQKK